MNSPVRSRDAEDDIDIIIDDDEGEDAAAADAYGISWGLCKESLHCDKIPRTVC